MPGLHAHIGTLTCTQQQQQHLLSTVCTSWLFPGGGRSLSWLEGQADARLSRLGRRKRGPSPKVPKVGCVPWVPEKGILQAGCVEAPLSRDPKPGVRMLLLGHDARLVSALPPATPRVLLFVLEEPR